jgi:hypothetical protein
MKLIHCSTHQARDWWPDILLATVRSGGGETPNMAIKIARVLLDLQKSRRVVHYGVDLRSVRMIPALFNKASSCFFP